MAQSIPMAVRPQRPARSASGRIWVVTGTDTGVGKTVLSAVLTAALRQAGVAVAALKPVCSGGRDDARLLYGASGRALTLDEINPWHFPQPLAPALAARHAGRRLTLAQVASHAKNVAAHFEVVILEAAGGLLSPLGVDFDTRDLIRNLEAVPWVTCPNRLGAVNQALLVVEALARENLAANGTLVLMDQPGRDASVAGNVALIRAGLRRRMQSARQRRSAQLNAAGGVGAWRVLRFPWLGAGWRRTTLAGGVPPSAGESVAKLLRGTGVYQAGFSGRQASNSLTRAAS